MSPAAPHPVAIGTFAPLWGASDAPSSGWRHTLARDADEHASQLTGWAQHYDQLSCGTFEGELTELHLPQMQVFKERISRAVRQSCTVWPDALWFGLPDVGTATAEALAPIRIDGRVNASHEAMVRPGDEPFELMTPDAHSIFGVVVQREALMRAAEREGCAIDWAGLQHTRLLQSQTQAHAQCLQMLHAVLGRSDAVPTPTATQMHTLQAELMGAMLHLLDHSRPDDASRASLAKRQQVVARARDHVLAHPDQAVTVPELCEQLHVSRRTLQYCFEDVLGISPLQYLRAIRLNGARRHLRLAAARHQSVQDVAVHWGFWHFSQFATDYRKLFGETPSATLKGQTH